MVSPGFGVGFEATTCSSVGQAGAIRLYILVLMNQPGNWTQSSCDGIIGLHDAFISTVALWNGKILIYYYIACSFPQGKFWHSII